VLAVQPRSWWWDGFQYAELEYTSEEEQTSSDTDAAFVVPLAVLKLYLCASGRFVVIWANCEGETYVIVDDRDGEAEEVLQEFTRSGGNVPEVLPQATVKWTTAWEAVAGFLLKSGERQPTLNWIEYCSVEEHFCQDIMST
jgi:hypothetical protein